MDRRLFSGKTAPARLSAATALRTHRGANVRARLGLTKEEVYALHKHGPSPPPAKDKAPVKYKAARFPHGELFISYIVAHHTPSERGSQGASSRSSPDCIDDDRRRLLMKSSVCCASRGFLRDQPSDFSWGSGSGDDPLRFRVRQATLAPFSLALKTISRKRGRYEDTRCIQQDSWKTLKYALLRSSPVHLWHGCHSDVVSRPWLA